MVYARPDDPAEDGETWRDQLARLNQRPGAANLDLLPAVDLYANPTYHELERAFGRDRLFILSAGWGLIPAWFLTPAYDITFSNAAERYKRRRRGDRYADFRMLTEQATGPVLFFGGKDYAPFFATLTAHVASDRVVFYSAAVAPSAPGCRLIHFPTSTRTNWHCECANALLEGALSIA